MSESLEELIDDASFGSCNCIGWLRPDFESHFNNTYNECKRLLNRMNVKDLENVSSFMNVILDNRSHATEVTQ